MSNRCRKCGSYAINPGHHGRPPWEEKVDHDLCDVCFWRTRCENNANASAASSQDVVVKDAATALLNE